MEHIQTEQHLPGGRWRRWNRKGWSAFASMHRCVTIGREVQLLWQDTKEKVTALDVDEEFGLIVRRENGTVETVRTGEVSVRGLYGYVE